jgi:hypothetical protein
MGEDRHRMYSSGRRVKYTNAKTIAFGGLIDTN